MIRKLVYPIVLIAALSLSLYSCAGGGKSGIDQATLTLFKQNCALCHGTDGKLGVNGAKDLRLSELSLAPRIELIKKGKGLMIGFENTLTADQIEALAKYTLTFK